MIDVSIIIVTWNSRTDLQRCLPSIPAACSSHAHEVIVVDNNSNDGTHELIRTLAPSSIWRANGANLGFAAANNQGFVQAQGRCVLLLNPDTVLHERACDCLVEFMDAHPGAWACGPALLNADGSLQRTGVHFPSIWNIFVEAFFLDRLFPRTRLFGGHRQLYADPELSRPVDYLQGSCLLVRREAIDRIGGLDQSFFMYFEETDWCRRMKDAGGEVWYVPAARVVHLGGDAFGHFDERRLLLYYGSLLRFFTKHSPGWEQVALRLILVPRSILRMIIWVCIGIVSSGERRVRAMSSCRGYVRTLKLLTQRLGEG